MAKFLQRRGLLEADEESSYLTLESAEDEAMQQLYGHSITYRIVIGPNQGKKVFTLQSLPPMKESKVSSSQVAKLAGFSLHAGVMAEAHQRDKLERLCRYIARPALRPAGLPSVVQIAPGDLVAPNSKHRILVTPSKRGKGRKRNTDEEAQCPSPAECRAAMTGFCSCKTGIHAIPGNDLGAAIEACIQY